MNRPLDTGSSSLASLHRAHPSEPKAKDSDLDCLLGAFEQYLAQERGLSPATLENYLPAIRHFLTERSGTGHCCCNSSRRAMSASLSCVMPAAPAPVAPKSGQRLAVVSALRSS